MLSSVELDSLVPLLGATGWPVRLRVAHAIEIVVFALVYAFALQRILAT